MISSATSAARCPERNIPPKIGPIRNAGYAFRTHAPEQLQAILYTVGNIEYGKACLIK